MKTRFNADLVAKYMTAPYTVNLEATSNVPLSEQKYDKIVREAEQAFDNASPEEQLSFLEETDGDIERAASLLIENKLKSEYPDLNFVVKYL